MTEDEMKQWIDDASYEQLLSRWRFGPDGDLMFQGNVGEYYDVVMRRKQKEAGDVECCRISKKVGWR